nr:MAG TPA: hypothetical protein [Caudoviricetes sp.]
MLGPCFWTYGKHIRVFELNPSASAGHNRGVQAYQGFAG